jgi:DNA-binding winged helix-turn-helix (wHTH) protein
MVGSIAAICCAGEGIFNTELTGPGTIYLQSMSIDKLRRLFPPQLSIVTKSTMSDRVWNDRILTSSIFLLSIVSLLNISVASSGGDSGGGGGGE